MVSEARGLSILVCTFNRAPHLARCLASIAAQPQVPLPWETVVVDNASTDDTAAVVDRFQGRIPGLRCVAESRVGLSHARNRAIEEAAHSHAVFVDDDAFLPPGYLQVAATLISTHDPDLFGGPVYPFFEAVRPAWFPERLEIRRLEDRSGFSRSCGLTGANFGARVRTLRLLGGFDPELGMRGGKPGFMEERDILERYRHSVPPDSQRVYYDLDLSVLHSIQAQKLKFDYQVHRAWSSGVLKGRVLAAAKHADQPWRFAAFRTAAFLGGFPKGAAAIIRHAVRHRRLGIGDFVEQLLHAISRGGQMAGAWQSAIAGPRTDAAPARPADLGDV